MCSIEDKAQKVIGCKAIVSGTSLCLECGSMMCPICHRHNVTQISRVTGYMSDVSGWNEGKRQEFKDRKRYNI